ncbi:MAG: tRNA (adenosine(37)-N6)-threonylcarbamoyltransferase complex dimerization subunit type 1 TsaB [Oscillospiraceae bacterium]|nr:tRNA (adenosine(37)-N6)-threonylcarbamoyltransferase complex dimerization subunit type 1 TsaB [Oscillospiraceae bacterium]
MIILSIDTSSNISSICISDNEDVISYIYSLAGPRHSQTLMNNITHCLSIANIDISDIDLFAVSNGPGSFTGLRIGISTIVALSMALDKPCIGISSIDILGNNNLCFDGDIHIVIDAKSNMLYHGSFLSKKFEIKRVIKDRLIDEKSLLKEISDSKNQVLLIGDYSNTLYNNLKDRKNINILPKTTILERATILSNIALERYKNNKNHNCFNLFPNYIGLSQAEREIKIK